MKNNTVECVLLSPDEYIRLLDEVNDARLLASATERMSHFNPATVIPQKQVDQEMGFQPSDFENTEALEDLRRLDGSQQFLIRKAIQKVCQNPLPETEGGYGKLLGNKNSTNLSGFLKIKLRGAGMRIVYQLIRRDDEHAGNRYRRT